ncbi:hypothetical protein [Nocardia sp. CA-120079]|uniref:hypothetical protein n=1 Tax=Nocardia sp. CA-120079 TaxID=3239974 RepID=UPI003D985ABB
MDDDDALVPAWSAVQFDGSLGGHRCYHGALTIGADSREHMLDILAAPTVSAVVDNQSRVLTAAHAYTIDRTIMVIRNGRIVPFDQRWL